MALAQADRVARLLNQHHPDLALEIVPLVASGDRHTGNLASIGGKVAWVRELDEALVNGALDASVSCAKDCPAPEDRPPGIATGAVLARDDVRDALVLPADALPAKLTDLPPGTRIGTSAPRRIAQLKRLRPDLDVVPLRGNLNTRLERVDARVVDAALVAFTGLARIGQADRAAQVFEPDEISPAAGAGTIVIEHHANNQAVATLLARLNDPDAAQELAAERAVLATLHGHCHSSIAAHAICDGTNLRLCATVWSADGSRMVQASGTASPGDGEQLGTEVAAQLVRQGARAMIDAATEDQHEPEPR